MLFADDAIKVGECLFLFANNFNMLFSINLSDGKMAFWGGIPEEHILSKRLTCKLIYLKKHIIVVPLLAKKIWIYSLESGEWRSITIENYEVDGQQTYFRQAVLYKDSLFFIGGHYPAILRMDLPSCKLTYLKEPFLDHANIGDPDELYFRGDFVYKGDTIYLASGRDNTVLIYHLDTETYQWIEVGKKENTYSGIMWDGNNYWLSPRKNTPIVKWDGDSSATEYEIPQEKRVDGIAYSGIVKKDNKIIIPALAKSKADTIVLTDDGIMQFNKKEYTFYKETESGDYLSQDSDGKITFVSSEGIKRQYRCELSGNRLLDLLEAANLSIDEIVKMIKKENEPFSLRTLLDLMGKVNISSILEMQNTGYEIWTTIKL